MKLSELAPLYRAGEEVILERIRELTEQMEGAADPEEIRALGRRIGELKPMMRQCRELAELTARYYERGYCRNAKYTV